MPERAAWIGTVQENDNPGDDHDEVVTVELPDGHFGPGAVIETTDGRRITITEAVEAEAA